MAKRPVWLALAATLLVAGCAGGKQLLSQAEVPQDIDWRRVATTQDRQRIREWRRAWIEALAIADPKRSVPQIAGEPRLFDIDGALPDAALAAGRYRCRVTKLGGRDPAARPVTRGDWTACRVERDEGRMMFSLDGNQRLHGYLFDDTLTRQVFLGTLALGDETRAMRYGRDARRDVAGLIERIGTRRWRLVLPYPRFESTLDVIEILPVG